MTEAWAWGHEAEELINRLDWPCNSPVRCQDCADIRRTLLDEEIIVVLRPGRDIEENPGGR